MTFVIRQHRSTAALAAVCVAFGLVSSRADNLPYAAPRAGYSWQGPYVGANLGYQWSGIGRSGADPRGAAGGAQAGYIWQRERFVFGGEADLQVSDADDRFASWKFSNPWFGTLRARAGVAMNNILFYGTVGLAYGALKVENTATGVSESHTSAGWTAGGGLEVGLFGNWSARAEYLYVDLGDRTYSLTGSTHGASSNVLRFGINYRF